MITPSTARAVTKARPASVFVAALGLALCAGINAAPLKSTASVPGASRGPGIEVARPRIMGRRGLNPQDLKTGSKSAVEDKRICGGDSGDTLCSAYFDDVYSGDMVGVTIGQVYVDARDVAGGDLVCKWKKKNTPGFTGCNADERCEAACRADKGCEFWVRSTVASSKRKVKCWKKKQITKFSQTSSDRRGRQIRENSRACLNSDAVISSAKYAKYMCCSGKAVSKKEKLLPNHSMTTTRHRCTN